MIVELSESQIKALRETIGDRLDEIEGGRTLTPPIYQTAHDDWLYDELMGLTNILPKVEE